MAERTDVEHRLAASLKELAVSVPFEKITIKQITDGAGVIRVTFYNHFQDKYDLLEWIIRTEIIEPVRILLVNGMYRDALILMFNNVLKEKAFYCNIVDMEGQNSLEEIVRSNIRELMLDLFREAYGRAVRNPEHEWMTPEYLSEYYAHSMTFVVIYWVRQGMPIPPEELATVYEYIGRRSMWDVFGEIAPK